MCQLIQSLEQKISVSELPHVCVFMNADPCQLPISQKKAKGTKQKIGQDEKTQNRACGFVYMGVCRW